MNAFRFSDITCTHSAAVRYTDLTEDRQLDTYALSRMKTLRDILSTKLADDTRCHFNVPWQRPGLIPDDCPEHSDYVNDFSRTLVQRLSTQIERRVENKLQVGIHRFVARPNYELIR